MTKELTLEGFTFQLSNVDSATRMEASTPTPGDRAAIQHMQAADLLAATIESEAKVATLKEAYEELIRYSVAVDATQSSPSQDGSQDIQAAGHIDSTSNSG